MTMDNQTAETLTQERETEGTVASTAEPGKAGGKFLNFFLEREEYGIEILKVREIIGTMTITPVPRTPDYMRGVINLRGTIIPVVDLRLKLDMESTHSEDGCIIVVEAQGVQMGIVVDRVSEVLDIKGENIENAPTFGPHVNTDYVLGIGKANDGVKLLLDIDKVLSPGEITDIRKTTTR